MTQKKAKTLVLLDGNALIHRAYHALPPLTTKEGELVNAAYGFTLTLLSVLEKFKPEYIAASFDLAGPTFRDEMYKDYKATRVKGPDDLYAQIPRVKEIVRAFNIPIFEKEGYEADDCVGTLARQAEKKNVEVIIVTGDNDVLQLVTPVVKVFTLRKGIKDTVLYDEKEVEKKYGFKPVQIPDYKGLAGDASDNIPGVTGIGGKTATTLLQSFGTLENIYAHLAEVKESVRKKLETDKKNAFLSKELGAIDTTVPMTLDLLACVSRDFDRVAVVKLFQELGFYSLLKRLPGAEKESKNDPSTALRAGQSKNKPRKIVTKEELEKFLGKAREVAVYVKQSEGTLFGTGIESIHIAVAKESEAIVVWSEQTKKWLKEFLEDEKRKKVVYDGKALLHIFKKERIDMRGIAFDVLIAAYLLNSGGNVEFEYLLLEECGEEEMTLPAEKLLFLREAYEKKLDLVSKTQEKGKTLRRVFENIEMPLLLVLYEVEENGIRLNTKKFRALSDELAKELVTLEKDIYKFSGREFNINSPKQLSEVLFQDLKIPTQNIKKTKTGISTASAELQKLQAYPIVAKIESYRELFKLKTTYLDALPALVDGASRLHTTFNQAVAATGRLSSSDPNLQNIPARSTWGERIRGAFEAEKGYVFVGADYSQIELRVMAHLSGDKALVEAFERSEDVHSTTAAVVYKVKQEEVTAAMRQQAKVFNFGIMYGMGAYGLAQAAEIDQKEAAQFIATYFKKFSKVALFLEIMKKSARTHGFVETELGRRRYTPEITSTNVQVARAAERMATNMPIQGMAADIMKLSMLSAEKLVKEYGDDARMVLQIHDELIFEVKETSAREFAAEIKKVMEHAYPLRVPLTVEVMIGKNWGEI
ncbi:MAG: DNA polymerase I [Candidatus Moranbacteria bacterium]|nr:DNA polymerase I [Candidatus Moranbacteria bacterium]